MATEETVSSLAPRQICHLSYLSACDQEHLAQALAEKPCRIVSGWSPSYCSWWQDQSTTQSKLLLFLVQLVGDAEDPERFTCMGYADLAFCSKWGQKLVEERDSRQPTLQAIVPVLTEPDIVQSSVAGLLRGKIKLSAPNVESVLVLANAIGFDSLEDTCIGFLSDAVHMMTPETLLCLAKLAEHLSLSSLLDNIANAAVVQPWEDHTKTLQLVTSYLHQTKRDLKAFLHHPNRGACAELQVLQLLEDSGVPERIIPDVLDVTFMGPAEIRVLLRILLDESHSSHNLLLRKALHQHVNKAAPQSQMHSPTHIMDNIMIPNSKDTKMIPLPESELEVMIQWKSKGDDTGVGSGKIYLGPQYDIFVKPCSMPVRDFTIFALDTKLPCIRSARHATNRSLLEKLKIATPFSRTRGFFGFPGYLTDLAKSYAEDCKGPFCAGVKWKPFVPCAQNILPG